MRSTNTEATTTEATTVETTTAALHPATQLGAVALTITNLERSLAFYQQVLGFQLQQRTAQAATLGAGQAALLHLVEEPAARQVCHHTGLYHFAVLTPSRVALGQVLRSLVAHGLQIGGADHLVSEAIYLNDPDGIGIEIYCDRPRAQWQYTNGQLVIGSRPLDYQGLLCGLVNEPTAWAGLAPETVIGHIHLHVDHLLPAVAFYRDCVGFDVVVQWQNAVFFATGGYHHHIGTNTWAGVGAPPQPADAVGLRHFTIMLHDESELARIKVRLIQANVSFTEDADGLLVRDPAQNGLLFVNATVGNNQRT